MKVVEQDSENVLRERFLELGIHWRQVAIYVALSLGSFLLGFVPMWLRANEAIEQRDAAQHELRLIQMQKNLGTAIVDVQRGEYEPARQTMSDFYTNLRNQIDAGSKSVFTAAQRERLKPLLGERDEVITLLAQSDAGAADRLSSVYTSYLKLTSNGG